MGYCNASLYICNHVYGGLPWDPAAVAQQQDHRRKYVCRRSLYVPTRLAQRAVYEPLCTALAEADRPSITRACRSSVCPMVTKTFMKIIIMRMVSQERRL